jgi:alkylhydroperoxidase family enzyme
VTSPEQRLLPCDPSDWNERTRQILGGTLEPVEQLEGGDGRKRSAKSSGPLNILHTIAHHPALLEPFLAFSTAIAVRGVLSRRSSELLALRAAWNCRSPFEWAHHVVYARAAGLDAHEIARIGRDADDPGQRGQGDHAGWDDADRELLIAADELHAGQRFSDETWALLRARYDDAQLVEIPFVVGQYTMLSMVANGTGVAVEPGLPELPEPPSR